METQKKCSVCKQLKEQSEFAKDKQRKDGLRAYCRACIAEKNKITYRTMSREQKNKVAIYQKRWCANNREKINTRQKIWVESNRNLSKSYRRKHNEKRRSAPGGILQDRMSCRVYQSLKSAKSNKRGRSWEKLVGYTTEQLKKHLQKHFLPGMSWGNFGQWHIDHKIPITAFNIETTESLDFNNCWKLKNLQPLWALDNLKKKDKLSTPFQPSLNIGRS